MDNSGEVVAPEGFLCLAEERAADRLAGLPAEVADVTRRTSPSSSLTTARRQPRPADSTSSTRRTLRAVRVLPSAPGGLAPRSQRHKFV